MPQAILLQDVDTLGERGAVVDVSAGYLRNFLLPRKLAEPATDSSIKVAQRRQADAERAAREAEERARESASVLGRTVLTITQQAGDDGRLFGSVTHAGHRRRDSRGTWHHGWIAARSTSTIRSGTSGRTWSWLRSPTK